MAKHPLTVEDVLAFKLARDAQISPDGELIAFTVAEPFKTATKKPKSQIWVVGTRGAAARPFTTGPRTDELPRWSPDSRTLAFLSDRGKDGEPQIYLLSRDGGEAQAATHLDGKILDLQWMPTGHQIAFLKEDAETAEEKKRKQDKSDPIEFQKNEKFARVWLLDVETHVTRQVTRGDVHVWEFEPSPDGSEFVVLVSDGPYEQEWYRTRLARVPVEGGIPENIYTPGANRQLALPRWSPAARRDTAEVAFISCLWSDRGVIAGDLCLINGDGSNFRNLTRTNPAGNRPTYDTRDVSWFEWTESGKALVVMGYENGDAAVGIIDVGTGQYTRRWTGDAGFADRSWQHFTLSRDQKLLAAVREDRENPFDIWTARLGDGNMAWQQLSHLNPQSAEIETGKLEKITWHSRDGLEIQGYLQKPIGYEPGKRYPLVVWVHGGPAGNYGPRYYAAGTAKYALFASSGIMVLLPNPRGSVGWGTEFTESNVGDLGGMDWQDVLTGVEYLVARGFANKERLGLAGWSYGGFMTAWGIASEGRSEVY